MNAGVAAFLYRNRNFTAEKLWTPSRRTSPFKGGRALPKTAIRAACPIQAPSGPSLFRS